MRIMAVMDTVGRISEDKIWKQMPLLKELIGGEKYSTHRIKEHP